MPNQRDNIFEFQHALLAFLGLEKRLLKKITLTVEPDSLPVVECVEIVDPTPGNASGLQAWKATLHIEKEDLQPAEDFEYNKAKAGELVITDQMARQTRRGTVNGLDALIIFDNGKPVFFLHLGEDFEVAETVSGSVYAFSKHKAPVIWSKFTPLADEWSVDRNSDDERR